MVFQTENNNIAWLNQVWTYIYVLSLFLLEPTIHNNRLWGCAGQCFFSCLLLEVKGCCNVQWTKNLELDTEGFIVV